MLPNCHLLQSPDSAKVKEELSRLHKRLKASKKSIEEKEKNQQEQITQIAKLQSDLQSIQDGKCISVWLHTT